MRVECAEVSDVMALRCRLRLCKTALWHVVAAGVGWGSLGRGGVKGMGGGMTGRGRMEGREWRNGMARGGGRWGS